MFKYIAIFCIQVYRYCISPLFPSCCRFYPTCSEYAAASIKKHGIFKGGYYSALRILKCHPFHPGGHDPIR